MTRKSRGFTLIELLVVIAIIAILAAMLFPVFARARESARKIQCLSNVKNIAMAFQMYVGDWESFPPGEHRQEVYQWFSTNIGGSCETEGCCYYQGNPYLRWPVVLDEYVKNRDVWRCPSAKLPHYPGMIVPGRADWLSYWKNGGYYCNCVYGWPEGWGGTVTDSNQNADWCASPGADTGAPEISLATNEGNHDRKLSSIDDPVKFIITADAAHSNSWAFEQVAFADLCRTKWGANVDRSCGAQWENCSDTVSCGLSLDLTNKFWTDSSFRKQYTRHMGGSNLGFLDGHAAWWAADAIIAAAGTRADPHPGLEGYDCQCMPEAWDGIGSPAT
jgi:prepilin-type N-terminal cleavage/methylation domain-containing protein/prepilin-type processing-associated H-X9-DG protein